MQQIDRFFVRAYLCLFKNARQANIARRPNQAALSDDLNVEVSAITIPGPCLCSRFSQKSIIGAVFAATLLCITAPSHAITEAPIQPQVNAAELLGKLPMAFEENQGQVNAAVKFISRGPGYKLFLTGQEAVMVLEKSTDKNSARTPTLTPEAKHEAAVVRMRFEGANKTPSVAGEAPLDFQTNYLVDNDPGKHVTGIQNHRRVKYTSLYPGVDLLYYGNQQQLEYDLVVAPHADPKQIKLSFKGANKIKLSKNGNLIVSTPLGDLAYHKPVAYQDIEGHRTKVEANYLLAQNGQVSFRLGKYDNEHPLVIDPIVAYLSFLWQAASNIALDTAGNVYIVGSTIGSDLPASNGYQTALAGSIDAYVAKLDPTGTKVIYATYLGVRRAVTNAQQIAVDAAGHAYIVGNTNSSSFPITAGAYQTSARDGGPFVVKLNPNGNGLIYSTYFSGVTCAAVALDSTGSFYMTGNAFGLVATAGAFQSSNPTPSSSAPFVAKLNATGTNMLYATYLGGSSVDNAKSIAVDASGNAFVTGKTTSTNFPTLNAYQPNLKGTRDAFVTKLNPSGTGLIYSTYLGGTNYEDGNGITINAAGEAYIVGQTYSADFPVTPGVFQPYKGYPGYAVSNGFITKLSASGNKLIYSSFIGGSWCSGCGSAWSDNDRATSVAVDAAGYVYIGGIARSPAFPVTDPVQTSVSRKDGEGYWPFFAKITPLADRWVYSTMMGTNDSFSTQPVQIAVDADGNAWSLGGNSNNSYPPTPVAFPFSEGALLTSGGAYLIKLSTGKYPTNVLSSHNPAVSGENITLTADVLNTKTGGMVTFMDGVATLGTVLVADGKAMLTVNLPAGVHTITAVYDQDGKVSPPYYQVVNSQ